MFAFYTGFPLQGKQGFDNLGGLPEDLKLCPGDLYFKKGEKTRRYLCKY